MGAAASIHGEGWDSDPWHFSPPRRRNKRTLEDERDRPVGGTSLAAHRGVGGPQRPSRRVVVVGEGPRLYRTSLTPIKCHSRCGPGQSPGEVTEPHRDAWHQGSGPGLPLWMGQPTPPSAARPQRGSSIDILAVRGGWVDPFGDRLTKRNHILRPQRHTRFIFRPWWDGGQRQLRRAGGRQCLRTQSPCTVSPAGGSDWPQLPKWIRTRMAGHPGTSGAPPFFMHEPSAETVNHSATPVHRRVQIASLFSLYEDDPRRGPGSTTTFSFFLVIRPYGGWMARRDQSGVLRARAGRYTCRTPDTAAKRRAGKILLQKQDTLSRGGNQSVRRCC